MYVRLPIWCGNVLEFSIKSIELQHILAELSIFAAVWGQYFCTVLLLYSSHCVHTENKIGFRSCCVEYLF